MVNIPKIDITNHEELRALQLELEHYTNVVRLALQSQSRVLPETAVPRPISELTPAPETLPPLASLAAISLNQSNRDIVREVVTRFPGQFITREVVTAVSKLKKIPQATFSQTITDMVAKKRVRVVRKKSGTTPAIYENIKA